MPPPVPPKKKGGLGWIVGGGVGALVIAVAVILVVALANRDSGGTSGGGGTEAAGGSQADSSSAAADGYRVSGSTCGAIDLASVSGLDIDETPQGYDDDGVIKCVASGGSGSSAIVELSAPRDESQTDSAYDTIKSDSFLYEADEAADVSGDWDSGEISVESYGGGGFIIVRTKNLVVGVEAIVADGDADVKDLLTGAVDAAIKAAG